MEGLNLQFKSNPVMFMRQYVMDYDTTSSLGSDNPPEAGIVELDIKHNRVNNNNGGGVLVRLCGERLTRPGVFTRKIVAHWLPWASKETTSYTLNNDARFFFTSALGGCRIQISNEDVPTVLHIAGDSLGGSTQLGTQWRENQAQQHLGQKYPQSRRFSSLQDYDLSVCAFIVGYLPKHETRWRFIAQGYGYDPTTGQFVVSQLTGGSPRRIRIFR
jgi:hypothetical protein